MGDRDWDAVIDKPRVRAPGGRESGQVLAGHVGQLHVRVVDLGLRRPHRTPDRTESARRAADRPGQRGRRVDYGPLKAGLRAASTPASRPVVPRAGRPHRRARGTAAAGSLWPTRVLAERQQLAPVSPKLAIQCRRPRPGGWMLDGAEGGRTARVNAPSPGAHTFGEVIDHSMKRPAPGPTWCGSTSSSWSTVRATGDGAAALGAPDGEFARLRLLRHGRGGGRGLTLRPLARPWPTPAWAMEVGRRGRRPTHRRPRTTREQDLVAAWRGPPGA